MSETFAGDRLAKVIARAGLCSRRDAEGWIKDGRVAVNGKTIRTPAFNVTGKDRVTIDGQPLAAQQGTRVWLYHKPAGLVVTEKDPEGRETIFQTLEEQGLPRVVSVGRLDINTEGLLLLTNDGGLKRVLELPATGWLRRYRVRAFGTVTQQQLDALKDGITVDGVDYGPIEATLERRQGGNAWLVIGLREGKNREIKNVLAALGLQVNRLIRTSFGPFQLGDLPIGGVEVVRARVLREQLGRRLADEAGVDFDSELPEPAAQKLAREATNPHRRVAAPGKEAPKQREGKLERFRFTDRPDRSRDYDPKDAPMRKDRPGSNNPRRAPREVAKPVEDEGPPRTVFNEDGSETVFKSKTYGKRPKGAGKPAGGKPFGDKPAFKRDGDRPPREGFGERKRSFGDDDRPKRSYGDKPRGAFGDRPKRAFSDKPRGDFGDRPKRDYGDKPRGDFGDRPKRPYAPRSAEGADRPKRSYGDKPRGDFADRPKRSYGDKPKGDFGDRPKRPYSPRTPGGATEGKRPYTGRNAATDGAERPKRPYGSKPGGDFGDRPKRSFGAKPRGPRADGDKPFGKRPPRSGAPRGERPDRGGRPPRPAGDRPPRRPRES